ncbi:MAG: hypothetical protein IKS17_01870 [Firmicutes bacterium]|nr:hypothetical protein [Bacillota bacterium]
MKKIISVLLVLVLTGCGAAKPANDSIIYHLEDLEPQRALMKTYGRDLKADPVKTVEEMDDITDEIFSKCVVGSRVYRDRKDPRLMVYYNAQRDDGGSDGYSLAYEVLCSTKEHRPFIDDITDKTGLLFSGMVLGGKYASDEGIYSGRNKLSFSNPAYALLSCDRSIKFDLLLRDSFDPKGYENTQYRDLPVRVDFFTDGDEIKYVNIFFLTNEQNKTLTENNLKQLSFDPLAAELLNGLYGQNKDVSGKKGGVKYTLRRDVTDSTENLRVNVLSLEY